MKAGSIILVSFTAKEKDSEKILEETKDKPIPVIVGAGELLKGLDEALKEMNVNEEKEVVLPPEKAFGERKAELIRVVPLQEFKARNLNPIPGMIVDINGLIGRVQSVSGGRVRVDFNHELAGKTLVYKIKIEKELADAAEICKEFFKKYFSTDETPEINFNKEEGKIQIKVNKKELMQNFAAKEMLARTMLKYVEPIKKLEWIEEFDASNVKLE